MPGFQWSEHRSGRHHRASHAVKQEAASVGGSGFDKDSSPELKAAEIRRLLEELGPVYSSFGLYLSSRIDLLPAEFCREFSFIADSRPPLSAPEIHRVLEAEFSVGQKKAFARFDLDDVESRLLTLSMAAELVNGDPVMVTILRPEYCALKSGSLVPTFNAAILQEYCGNAVNDTVVLDFFACLRRKCDFTAQLGIMELMSYDSAASDLHRPRRIYPELSTNGVMTLARENGIPIDEAVRGRVCEPRDLSLRLCQAWLSQALHGSGFAVDPQPHNIRVNGNSVLFTGCDYVGLPSGTKDNLRNYFMATMMDDPDKAAMYLLREMWPTQRKVDPETFLSKFRQSAYFGVLQPVLGTNSNALAQLVFQHWKTALEYGYSPKPHLLCFYRGLFSVARIAQRLAPLGDHLREGMEEVRADGIVAQMKDLADWRYWFRNSDKFANILVSLPKLLDDALTRSSTQDPVRSRLDESDRRHARSGGSRVDLTMIFVLAALLLFLQSSNMNPWTGKAILLLILLAGAMALNKIGD